MSRYERMVTTQPTAAAETVPVIDDAYFRVNFGISQKDASQPVKYGSYAGTLGEMLTDPRCPVGGMIREAHTGGEDTVAKNAAVNQKFEALAVLGLTVTLNREPLIVDNTRPITDNNAHANGSKKK